MALITFHSNRLEPLIERLAARLRDDPAAGDPFVAHELCTASGALERYLKLALARRHGICANVRFSFLAQWLWQRIGKVVEVDEHSPLAPATLQWRILAAFDNPAIGNLPRLAAYLARADALMRFELARELAITFERYATYRPDWLIAWAQGESQPDGCGDLALPDAPWQAALWGHLAGKLQLAGEHPATVFLQRLAGDAALRQRVLPARLALFALPEIPPLYLDLLARMAAWMDIELYVLDPCRAFWYDIVTPKALPRYRSRGDAHATSGNSLLADWGRVTRASLSLLLDRLEPETSEELYIEPGSGSALHRLQQAILDLHEFTPPGQADGSIALHACHGARRQVEVLHDQLLDLFQHDASLQLDQVVVLSPRLDELADVIDAVFGAMPAERHLPYRIEGVSSSASQTLGRALDKLLALAMSRCEASRVLDLLAEPVLAQRFAFDQEAQQQLRDWVLASGIHWGLDGEHGFEHGLSRLLLGYALPDDSSLIAGILPAGEVAGGRAELLARFALSIDWLRQWMLVLRQEHQAPTWPGLLRSLLDQLLESAADEALADQATALRISIAALAEAWQQADFVAPLSVAVIRALLAETRVQHARPQGVLTFAPLSALRGLPFRVVCLLGMDEGVFPAAGRTREFDLMAAAPRPGDRQRSLEDRALFLDALLAAREKLIILYHGRHLRDDTPLPPSILVAQLHQALGEGEWLTEHPLQPFSRRYFDGLDPRLFSYASEYAAALNVAARLAPQMLRQHADDEEEVSANSGSQPPFLVGNGGARPASAVPAVVTLAELQRFLRHPGRFWLQGLGIELPGAQKEVADLEPLLPEPSGERRLRAHLLNLSWRQMANGAPTGLTFEHALAHARASGLWPSGELGAIACDGLWQEIAALAERLYPYLTAPLLAPVVFELDLMPEGKLTGALTLRACGLLAYDADKISASRELMLWLEHLLLCALRPPGVEAISRLFSPQGEEMFATLPAEEARARLTALLALYRRARHYPLPLFPRAARKFAETWTSNADQADEKRQEKALAAARQAWSGHQRSSWFEALDPWYALLTRGLDDPLSAPLPGGEGGDFARLAIELFGPLLAARQDALAGEERP